MASAYGIYNAFLAPGSPCELNIDHLLRNMLATRMTKAVGQDAAMIESLKEVTKLFEEAQTSVFKLMASVSWRGLRMAYETNDATGFCSQIHEKSQVRPCFEELRLRLDF
jgi:hypothetical protein